MGSIGGTFGSQWTLGGPLGLLRATSWPQLDTQGQPKGRLGAPKRRFGGLVKTLIFYYVVFKCFSALGAPGGDPKGHLGRHWKLPVGPKGVPGDAWGAALETLGSLWGARPGQSGRPVCQSYGNRRSAAASQVRSEVRVYLSDKSYD